MNTLIQGECLEEMKKLSNDSVDMILVDIPYGRTTMTWDVPINLKQMWNELLRITKQKGAFVFTATQPFTTELIMSNLKMFKHEIIWFKNIPTGMAQAKYAPMKYHENIIVFCKQKITTFNKQMQEREGKGKAAYRYEHYIGDNNHVKMPKVKKFYSEKLVNPSSIILINSVPNRVNRLHPTQKPVELMKYLIKTYSNPGETILDFTMGSGTTGVACKELNRDFIGIEINKEYFDIAKNRI